MENNPNWTKEEFLAYILLYAAHADTEFKDKEKSYISSKIDNLVYKKIAHEFEQDNDYQSVQKILAFQKTHPSYSVDWVLSEMEAVFRSDDQYNQLEHVFLNTIKRIFS